MAVPADSQGNDFMDDFSEVATYHQQHTNPYGNVDPSLRGLDQSVAMNNGVESAGLHESDVVNGSAMEAMDIAQTAQEMESGIASGDHGSRDGKEKSKASRACDECRRRKVCVISYYLCCLVAHVI